MLLSGLQTRMGLLVCGSSAVEAPLVILQRPIMRSIRVKSGNETLKQWIEIDSSYLTA